MGSQLCSGTHTSERAKEAVSAELNVLAHEARVHPDQLHEERVRDKSFSIATAFVMISTICPFGRRFTEVSNVMLTTSSQNW